ncbi:hypothetical protein, partial [Inquilinus limosus]
AGPTRWPPWPAPARCCRASTPTATPVAALVSVTAIWVTLSYQSEFFAMPQADGPALIRDLIVPTP